MDPAEIIADNVDLLTQILLFLPPKSLLRFKSVSKQWLSLISDSQFATKHHYQPSISGFFLCWECTSGYEEYVSLQGDRIGPSLDFLLQIGSVYRTEIINSCNGLLLCECSQVLCNVYIDQYFVCNPTTGAYRLIPEPRPGAVCFALLAFDPSKSPSYKVVFLRLHLVRENNPYVQIDIYCPESASWKQICAPCRSLSPPVLCSGVIYWVGYENVISGFDVNSEKMIEMKKTLKVQSTDMKYFGECGGRLILVQTRNALELEILEMDKDDCCWIVKCCVNLGLLLSVSPQLKSQHHTYFILCVVKGEEENDFALVLAFPERTIYYSPKHNSWSVLDDIGRGEYISKSDAAFPYIESLYPL